MELKFCDDGISKYHSGTQIARVLTEEWFKKNMFCPRCGNAYVNKFENNRPVADFYCPVCNSEYELKSKQGTLGKRINDGAYDTMIKRITSNKNPDFFFMSYSKRENKVTDLLIIPKHFFVPDIIERRNPLPPTARRAGWVGCNIVIEKVPEQGRISIISQGKIADVDAVIKKVSMSNRLEIKDINSRGWIMDVLNCVNVFPAEVFSLEDIYAFAEGLQAKHPENHNVKPKIRQQLQLLRDKGFLAFLGNGKYRKLYLEKEQYEEI